MVYEYPPWARFAPLAYFVPGSMRYSSGKPAKTISDICAINYEKAPDSWGSCRDQGYTEMDRPAMTTLDLVLKPKPGEVRRVMRIFISSTFTDMQGERDELVLRVLPELRQLCGSRGVVSGEVDLRWGITTEQRAEGQVL